MVCAMHRMFQNEEDDRIMEGDFDPAEEIQKRREELEAASRPGLLTRLLRLLPIPQSS